MHYASGASTGCWMVLNVYLNLNESMCLHSSYESMMMKHDVTYINVLSGPFQEGDVRLLHLLKRLLLLNYLPIGSLVNRVLCVWFLEG